MQTLSWSDSACRCCGAVASQLVTHWVYFALARVFDLVAKVLAVEDTIYELDRGVENDVLNLSDFVKSVRRLARDQFEARALVQKIFHLQRQAAGAPPGFS